MNTRLLLSTTLTALVASGCERPGTSQRLTALEDRITSLESDLKTHDELNSILFKNLSDGASQANQRLAFLTTRMLEDTFKQKTAILDPSSKGYSVLDTGRGSLLIACDGAEPYLDGYRIKLRFGNPLFMQFSGFRLTFQYGRKPPPFPTKEITNDETFLKAIEQWQRDRQTWKTTLQKSEESFTDDLKAGSWTTVEATLAQTKPEDIAYLEIAIETDRVSLTKQ